MVTMCNAAGFVIYLVLSLVTGRRIDRVQSHVQTVLISDISPGDGNDQQYRTEGQKEAMLLSLHNLVKNSFDGVDDDDLLQLYVMCQFDFILWKCGRLSSRTSNQQITDHNVPSVTYQYVQTTTDQSKQLGIDYNVQPETDQNVQTTTDQSKQLGTDYNVQLEMDQNVQTTTDQIKYLETDHNVQPETDQNIQRTTDQSKKLKIYHNVQLETDQNVQTTTDQIKQLKIDHNKRLKSNKDIQPTTEKPVQHEAFNKKDSELDWNLSVPVEDYETKEDDPDADDMGLAGSLLCQMCSSVKITAEREKCETRLCDY
ncbi:uncharacterized protein LOC110455309 [Mizuhopecten yessoensis]|uniref:Translation factor GUF1-like n=1 Tax=Mizuhopecten yessoensis TaxID=6573 RepID=A0A210QD79_MIZYE|nr:uncharacterized protein LOC110455309 [Mizuhopecten yessoensis]OWF46689.1 Translation factor GUF1-like [Mizuhopecten yessoensis]